MLLAALTCYVCFALKASKLPVFPMNRLYYHSVFYIYGLYHIYLYICSAIYVFSVRKGGGGGSELRFSVLLHHGLFFVFSVRTSISLVETPVDRRRFVFSSVMVAY